MVRAMTTDREGMNSGFTGNEHLDAIENAVARYIDILTAGEEIDRMQILLENPGIGHEILERLEKFINLHPEDEIHNPPLGTLGDYTLRREIGRGGMGVVYEAWENSMNRQVALKVLPVGVAADSKTFTRFVREAQVAGNLHHPNVVPVYGMGLKEKTPYYAMEYVKGKTLAQILALEKDAPRDQKTAFGFPRDDVAYYSTVARAFADVADGLQHAHSKGVIHRDIKPSNLIFDPEGRLRILDFGLARLEGQESLTVSGDFLGTVLYMSPEQAMSKRIPIDHRTDIYSLGATMYETLTLCPPFQGKHHQDTLSQIIFRDPRAPRQLLPWIPKDLETIVLKCLRKEPEDRYGTAEAAAQDLRRFVRGAPIEARPQGRWEKSIRRLWFHRWRLVTVTSLVLILALASFVVLNHLHGQHQKQWAAYNEEVQSTALKLQGASLLQGQSTGTANLIGRGMFLHFKHLCPEVSLVSGRVYENSPDALSRALQTAIDRCPDRPEAYYYQAKAFLLSGERQRAIEATRAALKADEAFVPACFLLAEILGKEGIALHTSEQQLISEVDEDSWQADWLKAHSGLQAARWQEVIDAFDQLYDSYRRGEPLYLGVLAETWLGRSKARLEAGQFQRAQEELAVAARYLWPEAIEPALLLGKAYHRNNQMEMAENIFEELRRRSPWATESPHTVPFLVSALYAGLGDFQGSFDWAGKIPDTSLQKALQADILQTQGRFPEAQEKAEEAIAANSSSLYGHFMLASVLCSQLRLRDAEKACEELLQRSPKHLYGLWLMGNIKLKQNRYDEALRYFEQAIRQESNHFGALEGKGRAFIGLKRYSEAKDVFLGALKEYPESSRIRAFLGRIYVKLGQPEEALKKHDEALKLDRLDVSGVPQVLLGRTYLDLNRIEESIECFHKAIDRIPLRSDALYSLVRALDRKERLSCHEELSSLIELLEGNMAAYEDRPQAVLARQVIALACRHLPPDDEYLALGIKRIKEAIERTSKGKDDLLKLLAELESREGRQTEAAR